MMVGTLRFATPPTHSRAGDHVIAPRFKTWAGRPKTNQAYTYCGAVIPDHWLRTEAWFENLKEVKNDAAMCIKCKHKFIKDMQHGAHYQNAEWVE